MKVTAPHMGTLHIAIGAFLREFGADLILPPPTSNQTLAIGSRLAPESACLPLKVTIGNFVEGYELGAEAGIMVGGVGPCRLGYYAPVQQKILADHGYDMEVISLEPPRGHLGELVSALRRLSNGNGLRRLWPAWRIAWAKLKAIDTIDRVASKCRPRSEPGRIDQLREKALSDLDRAEGTGQSAAIARQFVREAESCADFDRHCPRVGLLGEVFMILEPRVNGNVEAELGRLGLEVHREIYITDWLNVNLVRDFLRLGHPPAQQEAARPYLTYFVGGHGRENIGQAVIYARQGFDGLIQVAPLTCMPEIVAQTILNRVVRDFQIPLITLYYDEHAGDTGLVTRLEAFADLILRKEGTRCAAV